MPPQPSGNGTQFAGDDRTQLLAPVGKGSGCGRPYCDLQRKFGAEHGHFEDRRHPPYFRLADETAVIPVTPAQPGPKANNDDPWKECFGAAVAGLVLAAFIFVAGVLVGAAVF